jgi:AcrR family transcriptional regulator
MPRPADLRAKIELLRAAEAEFAEHGLSAAKIEAITARAGVSKGAFYLHFTSKEDCFRLIVESFLARFATCIEMPDEIVDKMPASLEELVLRLLPHDIAILEVCWQNRSLLRMLLDGGGGTPHAYLVEEFRERTRTQAEEWVRRAIEQGLYRKDIDPQVVCSLISGAYERLVQDLIKQEKKPDIEAWCRQLIDLFTRGLLAIPSAAGPFLAPANRAGAPHVNGKQILDPVVNREKKR